MSQDHNDIFGCVSYRVKLFSPLVHFRLRLPAQLSFAEEGHETVVSGEYLVLHEIRLMTLVFHRKYKFISFTL